MRKNTFVAGSLGIAAALYIGWGFLVQAMMGHTPWDTGTFAAGAAAVFGVVVGGGALWLISVVRKGPARGEPDPPGPALIVFAVVLLFAGSIGGGWIGYKRASEDQTVALANKAKAATAAYVAKQAALTPEQRAAAAKVEADRVAAAKAVEAAKAEAAAKAQAAKEAENARLQVAAAIAVRLKNAMKDPESFILRSALVMPSGASCYEYRAKNGFGATFPGSAVLSSKGKVLVQETDGNAFVSVWNKECTAPGGQELAPLLRQLGLV